MTPQEIKMEVLNEETNHLHFTSNFINTNTDEYKCTICEQDQFVPIANIVRIMRKILPSHAKISDKAKETIQECVSEFIDIITEEANERCKHEHRKTITADDIHWAISRLGFDEYVDPLSLYLHKYREFDGGKRGLMKKTYDQPNIGGLLRDTQGEVGSSGALLDGLDTSGRCKEQQSDG